MAEITINDLEVNEALTLTDLLHIYQAGSGGTRRDKQLDLADFRTFIQDLFTNLTVAGIFTASSLEIDLLKPVTIAYADAIALITKRTNSVSNNTSIISYGADETRYSIIKLSHDSGIELQPRLGVTAAICSSTEFEVFVATSKNPAGVWVATSDKDLKTGFMPITDAIDKLKFLAPKVQHFKFKDGVNVGLGHRTGIVIDDELEAAYPGHISYSDPQNEAEGIELGWIYKDENYDEEVPVMEILKVPSIVDGKIVYTDKEVQKTGMKLVDTLGKDKAGNDIITKVNQPVGLTETVTKTKRVVVTEGRQKRMVENSFWQYLFPALNEVISRLEILENK